MTEIQRLAKLAAHSARTVQSHLSAIARGKSDYSDKINSNILYLDMQALAEKVLALQRVLQASDKG